MVQETPPETARNLVMLDGAAVVKVGNRIAFFSDVDDARAFNSLMESPAVAAAEMMRNGGIDLLLRYTQARDQWAEERKTRKAGVTEEQVWKETGRTVLAMAERLRKMVDAAEAP